MDARVVEQNPYKGRENQVRSHFFLSDAPEKQCQEDDQEGDAQEQEIDFPSVEERYHKDGYEVVRYGEGGEEDFQRNRHLVAEDGQYAHCKSDVGGCRDTPARCRRRTVVDKGIDDGGRYHSSEGRYYRHERLLWR